MGRPTVAIVAGGRSQPIRQRETNKCEIYDPVKNR
jgi:hypothetical protein